MFKAQLTTDYSQGDIKTSGNSLDLALHGDGFFKIQSDNKNYYTRCGEFTLDNNSILSTANGKPVLGENGPITITGVNIQINSSGEVIVDSQLIDKLDIVTFPEKNNLKKIGGNLFDYMGNSNDEIIPENIFVKQGQIETPNVSVVTEMTKMINTHRMFETYQKMIQTIDEINGKAISEMGKA
jgi:flagellar basal-body rod protein FlgG